MDKKDLLLEKLKLSSELHRHMDDMIWSRFNYFITITTVLFTGYGLLQTNALPDTNSIKSIATIAIPVFGMFVSIIFTLILKRSQAYHYYRSKQAQNIEIDLNKEIGAEEVRNVYQEIHKQNDIKVDRLARIPINRLVYFMTGITILLWIFILYFSIYCPAQSGW